MLSTSLTRNSLTAIINGKVYNADSTHLNWSKILECVRNQDESRLIQLIDIKQSVINFIRGRLRIAGNDVMYDNLRLHGVVVDRLLNFIRDGFRPEPLCNFIEKLMKNPSQRAVNELYSFLEHKNLPITPSGNFLAYKGIKSDWYSITSGKLTLLQGWANSSGEIFNGIGQTVECVRNQVDDNKENHCSTGIHAGSLEYATDFAGSGKVVIVEIDPSDVVSIPSDCQCQKLRTCKYRILSEFERPLADTYSAKYSVGAEADDEAAWNRGYEDAMEGLFTQEESEDYLAGFDCGLEDLDEQGSDE
jgi:hypothetical protein